jgi:hypothetical protein
VSHVSEHFESLQAHLAQGQTRAERLERLLACDLDEAGRPSVFVLPEARALLSAALMRAADAAADLGIELFDVRWTAVVTLLHHASGFVRTMGAREARLAAELLRGLQVRVVQLRFRGAGEVRVRLS